MKNRFRMQTLVMNQSFTLSRFVDAYACSPVSVAEIIARENANSVRRRTEISRKKLLRRHLNRIIFGGGQGGLPVDWFENEPGKVLSLDDLVGGKPPGKNDARVIRVQKLPFGAFGKHF